MVNNPIYDGHVYEIVQQQFETLTATTLKATEISNCDNSVYQICSSQPSTPMSSEKSVRYVDPPVQSPNLMQSKSFVSSEHTLSPNLPRSTNVNSVPVTKKTGKNKLNLDRNASSDLDDNYAVMSPTGPLMNAAQ